MIRINTLPDEIIDFQLRKRKMAEKTAIFFSDLIEFLLDMIKNQSFGGIWFYQCNFPFFV
jgi:hypothetical protein